MLCAWEVTNELFAGASAATAYANYVAYCQARQAAGFTVVAFTCVPRGADADFETRRQATNALIRTNYATFATRLCDVGADATIGVPGAQNNATYYADTTHLNDAGYAIVAELAETEVLAA